MKHINVKTGIRALTFLIICMLPVQSCTDDTPAYTLGQAVFLPACARGFGIYSADGSNSVIRITDPWQGASGIERFIYVSRDGKPAPENFRGTTVYAPVRKVVCMSSSYVAMFESLGMADRVAGVSGAAFISSPAVRQRIDSGLVADVGYGQALDFELIAAINPDIVLLYGVADENRAITGKFDELGIPYGFIGDYLENTAIGKAEWTVAIGELCDTRPQAEAYIKDITIRYDSIRHLTDNATYRPKVMLNAPYRDIWFMPNRDSYIVSLLHDAGAEYVGPDDSTNMSLPITAEKAYTMLSQSDVWLNPGSACSLRELAAENSRFMDTPPVKNGRVFNNNLRMTPAGGSDFWESGTVRPDEVLSDIVRIIHPELCGGDETYHYYRRIE